MKIKFKHQQFQLDAVKSVVDCFEGQPNEMSRFTLDRGIRQKPEQITIEESENPEIMTVGFRNKPIMLTDEELLENIWKVQKRNGLNLSERLAVTPKVRCNLTVEMETGTGKTYTYIRTMFELYKKYGWSKYIVVVPSIAIREGVLKTFQITEDHFMAEYSGTRCQDNFFMNFKG